MKLRTLIIYIISADRICEGGLFCTACFTIWRTKEILCSW